MLKQRGNSSMEKRGSHSLIVNGQSQITNNELRITNNQSRITNNKSLITLLALMFVFMGTVFFPGCAKKPKEIKIGAILPLTGPSSLLGEMAKKGLILAEKDINSKGAIDGIPLKVIFEDGKADPNSSVSAFRKLITANKIKFVITTHSSVGLALAPIADKEKILLIVHASHPKITEGHKYTLRHSNIAEQESEVIGDFVKTEKINKRRISLAVMNDDYGMIFKKRLSQQLGIKGNNIIVYDQSETDFNSVVQKLLANNPNIVIIAGLGNGVGILLRRLKEYGYKGKTIITLGAVVTGAFQGAGESAKGVYFVSLNFDKTDKEYKRLNTLYKTQYHSDIPLASVLFYNSLNLLASCIKEVGYNPDKVITYLKSLKEFDGVGEKMKIIKGQNIVPPLKVIRYE